MQNELSLSSCADRWSKRQERDNAGSADIPKHREDFLSAVRLQCATTQQRRERGHPQTPGRFPVCRPLPVRQHPATPRWSVSELDSQNQTREKERKGAKMQRR